jgi:hypothetical protein
MKINLGKPVELAANDSNHYREIVVILSKQLKDRTPRYVYMHCEAYLQSGLGQAIFSPITRTLADELDLITRSVKILK